MGKPVQTTNSTTVVSCTCPARARCPPTPPDARDKTVKASTEHITPKKKHSAVTAFLCAMVLLLLCVLGWRRLPEIDLSWTLICYDIRFVRKNLIHVTLKRNSELGPQRSCRRPKIGRKTEQTTSKKCQIICQEKHKMRGLR